MITLPATASLSGSATDDGLPTPAALTTTWSKVSGPGTVTFANAASLSTTATFGAAGTYSVRLTADDGLMTVTDELTVIVEAGSAANQPPTADAGTAQTVILPATASLSGTVSDDGLPNPPAALTTTWSMVSGPGTVTFASASTLTTTATFSTLGTYVLRLTASDGDLITTDDVTITAAGLIGHWQMEGDLTDAAPPENNAGGTGSPTYVPGRIGQALSLNGTTQYATVPDSPDLDISNAITIAGWIKPTKTGDATQDLFKKATIDVTDGYEISLSSVGKVFVRFNQKTSLDGYRINSTTDYPHAGSAWMHVAATWDGATIKLYINGAQEGGDKSFLGPIATNDLPFGIGVQGSFALARLYQGAVDDVRLYSHALSAAEVLALYNEGTPSNQPPTVDAGTAQTIILPATASLSGTASDDGLPAALTTTWSTVSGPGTVTFANASSLATTATFSTLGTYVLRLTASDGELVTNDDVTITAAGLIGHWQMEEGSGTTLVDATSPANNGTIAGSPTWVTGRIGQALSLNGTTQYATVPDSTDLDISNAITMAAWVMPEQYATQDLLSKTMAAANGYQLSLSASDSPTSPRTVFVRFNNVAASRVDSTTVYPIDGTWIHVAATWDGTTVKVYYNGQNESSTNGLARSRPMTSPSPSGLRATALPGGSRARWTTHGCTTVPSRRPTSWPSTTREHPPTGRRRLRCSSPPSTEQPAFRPRRV